jgi:hypothetical protein
MSNNFIDKINEEAKQYGGGGSSMLFSFKELGEGTYKVRVLCQPAILATHFFGPGQPSVVCVGIDKGCSFHKQDDKKASIKLITYVIDRTNDEIKLAELPLSLSYGIQDLQNDPDYSFEEFPMPYDIKVIHDPKNQDPKAKYRMGAPGPKEDITEEEKAKLKELTEQMSPEDYVEKRKTKQIDKSPNSTTDIRDTSQYPNENINPDDIPF